MMPTRTLFVSLYTEMGGGEYGMYHLLEHIDRSRVEPILLVNRRGPLAEMVVGLGVEVVVVPFEVVMLKRLFAGGALQRNIRAAREIKLLISERGVRAVVCSDLLSLLLLLPSFLAHSLKVFYNVIFFYEPIRVMLFNVLALLFVDHIAVLSEMMKTDLMRKTFGLAGKVSTIYWGVDTKRFHPRSPAERDRLHAQLQLPSGKTIIGFIGRYEVWKGHLPFLDAVERLVRSRPDAIALIVGGAMTGSFIPDVAAYHGRVKERIAGFQPADALIVWDHRDDISEIMASLDLLVCSSDREPYGLVVLEALACGVPVVASSSVGALEVVSEEKPLFVAEPGNSDSLFRAMEMGLSWSKEGDGASKMANMVMKWPNWRDYSVLVEAKISG